MLFANGDSGDIPKPYYCYQRVFCVVDGATVTVGKNSRYDKKLITYSGKI